MYTLILTHQKGDSPQSNAIIVPGSRRSAKQSSCAKRSGSETLMAAGERCEGKQQQIRMINVVLTKHKAAAAQ